MHNFVSVVRPIDVRKEENRQLVLTIFDVARHLAKQIALFIGMMERIYPISGNFLEELVLFALALSNNANVKFETHMLTIYAPW